MSSSPSPQPPKPLSDSPLFWLLLFGGMALAMAAAIQPKFAQREARLERMYHSRQLAAQRSAAKANEAASEAAPEYQPAEPIVTVQSLMFLLATVLLAASVVLLFLRRGQSSGHET